MVAFWLFAKLNGRASPCRFEEAQRSMAEGRGATAPVASGCGSHAVGAGPPEMYDVPSPCASSLRSVVRGRAGQRQLELAGGLRTCAPCPDFDDGIDSEGNQLTKR